MMKLKINKQKFIIIGVVFILPILMSMGFYKKSAGSHPGSTGAPGELTCAKSGCHAGTTNSGVGTNTLTFSAADSTYIPGQTYNLSVLVQKAGIARFGFELTALKDSNNRGIGTFVITDATRTQIISAVINSQSRASVTHKTAGTPAITTGNTSWGVNWTAPTTNVGTITFYYATNCTNNNNASSGDAIYLSSFQIKPKVFASINEIINEKEVNIFFNKADNSIDVSYTLKVPSKVALHLFDMQGKEIVSTDYNHGAVGKYLDKLELKNNLSTGVYSLSMIVNDKVISRKILVQ